MRSAVGRAFASMDGKERLRCVRIVALLASNIRRPTMSAQPNRKFIDENIVAAKPQYSEPGTMEAGLQDTDGHPLREAG